MIPDRAQVSPGVLLRTCRVLQGPAEATPGLEL